MEVRNFKFLLLFLFFSLKSIEAHPPPPQPESIPPPVGAEVPIDSNVLVLALLGATLGLFFISRRISQKQ